MAKRLQIIDRIRSALRQRYDVIFRQLAERKTPPTTEAMRIVLFHNHAPLFISVRSAGVLFAGATAAMRLADFIWISLAPFGGLSLQFVALCGMILSHLLFVLSGIGESPLFRTFSSGVWVRRVPSSLLLAY